jgi:hypothetical protein
VNNKYGCTLRRRAIRHSYILYQNSDAADFEEKKQRVFTIGKELYSDGGIDTMENMFYSIEFRIKDEIGKDAKPYRSWWNDISSEWKY